MVTTQPSASWYLPAQRSRMAGSRATWTVLTAGAEFAVAGDSEDLLSQDPLHHAPDRAPRLPLVAVAQADRAQAMLRQAQQVGAETIVSPAVADIELPAVIGHLQAESVAEGIPVVQDAPGLHHFGEVRPADLLFLEIPLPAGQVLHGGVDVVRPGGGVVAGIGRDQGAVAGQEVADGLVGGEWAEPVVDEGAVHAQRLEDALPGEVGQGFSAGPRDDLAQQDVVRVTVGVLRARDEVESMGAENHFQLVLRAAGIGEFPAGEDGQPVGGPDAAGMVDQVADGHRLSVVGQLGQMPVDFIVQREFAILGQEQDAGGGELLGHRAEVEGGGRGDRGLVLQVGQAIALLEEDLAVLDYGHGAAGSIGRDLLLHQDQTVDPGCEGFTVFVHLCVQAERARRQDHQRP